MKFLIIDRLTRLSLYNTHPRPLGCPFCLKPSFAEYVLYSAKRYFARFRGSLRGEFAYSPHVWARIWGSRQVGRMGHLNMSRMTWNVAIANLSASSSVILPLYSTRSSALRRSYITCAFSGVLNSLGVDMKSNISPIALCTRFSVSTILGSVTSFATSITPIEKPNSYKRLVE